MSGIVERQYPSTETIYAFETLNNEWSTVVVEIDEDHDQCAKRKSSRLFPWSFVVLRYSSFSSSVMELQIRSRFLLEM